MAGSSNKKGQAGERKSNKGGRPKGNASHLNSTLKPGEVPDGLPTKYFIKSTFNTRDIMSSPVEKTISMINEILSGERLFTM